MTKTAEPTTEILTVDIGLPADSRCDRCGAQAYMEVQIGKSDLLFCVHHYTEYEDTLATKATRIVDHRPFLDRQEQAFKGGAPV